MIKIEMLPFEDPRSKSGVSREEYIWMHGNPWPVPEGDNHRVGKIEAFGAELDDVKDFPGGEVEDKSIDPPKVIPGYRAWYTAGATYISNEMRRRCAS